MKTKLIGIIICMLLIATTLVSAVNVNQKNITPTLFDADVPIWEVGDSWTYDINKTIRSDLNETMKYVLTGDIILSVKDDTGDYYILEGVGESISILGNIGKLNLRSSRIITVNIEMVVKKADLAISSYNFMFKGIVFIVLGPIILPFPIQLHEWRDSTFTPDQPVLPFPLFDGKNGTLISALIDEEWGLTMFWDLISIDTGDVSWHSTFNDYTCTATEVTIPSGTYDVYKVSDYAQGGGNHIDLYYNATVGNVVEIYFKMYNGDWHDWWLIQKLRLKSTTYTP